MPVITVRAKIFGILNDAELTLEGNKIASWMRNGVDTWMATVHVNVDDGRLNIFFRCFGVETSEWTLTITLVDSPDKEIYKKNGAIKSTGNSFVIDSVKI